MRTEESKNITKVPLILITAKGFLDQLFNAYQDELSSPYLNALSTKADNAKKQYFKSMTEEKKLFDERISALKERLPSNYDEYGEMTDQRPILTEKQRIRAEKVMAKIATFQNDISHCEEEFAVHCSLVDVGFEVIRYSYLTGYLFHKKGGLTND